MTQTDRYARRVSLAIPAHAAPDTVKALLAYARLGEFGFPTDLATGVSAYRAAMQERVQQLAEQLTGSGLAGFELRISAGLWATSTPPATAPTAEQVDALRAEFGVL
ncbi:hypothetical protein [Nocardia yamanashiensis]|uniref:hypothetical protein n=1 Tax=Nocardia yamanashiensis TaxID=209247 RepID=UPI00083664C4|nr:hypothetical protein [Nocardia yamanashiensis]